MTDYFALAARQARAAAQTVRTSTRTVQVPSTVQDSPPLAPMRVIYTDPQTGARVSTLVVDEGQLRDVAKRANGRTE